VPVSYYYGFGENLVLMFGLSHTTLVVNMTKAGKIGVEAKVAV